jgi:hypothetical protein
VELHDNSDSFGDGDSFPLVHVISLLLVWEFSPIHSDMKQPLLKP